MKPAPSIDRLRELRDGWMTAWPTALSAWSRYTRLKSPTLCFTMEESQKEGLMGSFAMIRLQDQAIVINLFDVASKELDDYALEILAHEIGHHVLAPANLTDHGRMLARMRWALPTVEKHAPMVANLYTDLLINDRLQRANDLRISEVYQRMGKLGASGAVWALYMRIYELLWKMPKLSLAGSQIGDQMEGDALLGSRLIRSYARDWMRGSGRFAALLLPYLLKDERSAEILSLWADTKNAGQGGDPAGLINEDDGERSEGIHPAQDSELTEDSDGDTEGASNGTTPTEEKAAHQTKGQAREPFEYGEVLRACGVKLNDHELAVRYYRERALPYLVPFPRRPAPRQLDPLPEGLEAWEVGQSLDEIDWLQSILQSPRVIPGLTTMRRTWGEEEGSQPRDLPLDLDIFVDSSGSMPNPQRVTSYPALAGAVMCLSALRAGARVQATLWSGKQQFTTTAGFVQDQSAILRVLTGHFGGATAFPIHVLRETYAGTAPRRPAHILVISDDGVSTMFDPDEQRNNGWDVAAHALRRAQGGGTLVLNIARDWEARASNTKSPWRAIQEARDRQGWAVHPVGTLEELLVFAREFSRRTYGEGAPASKS